MNFRGNTHSSKYLREQVCFSFHPQEGWFDYFCWNFASNNDLVESSTQRYASKRLQKFWNWPYTQCWKIITVPLNILSSVLLYWEPQHSYLCYQTNHDILPMPIQILLRIKHHMMTSSNGNTSRVTGPLYGEFNGHWWIPTQRPVTQSFDVFFDLSLNKRWGKQSWGWWFETPSCSLWRHCNDTLRASSNGNKNHSYWPAILDEGTRIFCISLHHYCTLLQNIIAAEELKGS